MKKYLFLAIAIFLFINNVSAQFRMSEGANKVASVMTIVEGMYVDKIDDNQFSEDAIKAIIEKLDPHSSYISAAEAREMNEPLEGNFDGIGISFQIKSDTLYIIETIVGGPSEKIGLRPGDKIIYVNDTLIAGVKKTNKDIMSRLRGKKGTTVDIKVLRRGVPQLIDFRITRDKIPIYSLDAAYMVDNNIGYIRLSRFGATTTQEFRDACKRLKNEGMKNLILDLEGNGGGYMSAAIDIVNDFLPKNRLIVYTEGANQPKQEFNSSGKGLFEEGKLVVLIDEYSASASEIVSGAVQDWDRAVIVGRRSFGKGLVQRQIPFRDESMLRLTVARYYTPTGRSIQRPYTNGDNETYNMDVVARYNRGEMMHADSIHFPDSLAYKTLVNERTVYGGGGIMPDYYVPVDTTANSTYIRKVYFAMIPNKIALDEVDKYRKDLLAKYPTAADFREKFIVDNELLDKVIAAATEAKIEFNEDEFIRSKPILERNLKVAIGRDLYDTEASVKIMNDYSQIFQKGMEIIKDNKLYNDLLIRKR